MGDQDTAGGAICCGLIILFFVIIYLSENWKTIGPIVPWAFYWLLIVIILLVIVNETYTIGKTSGKTALSSLCLISFGLVLIVILIGSGIAISEGASTTDPYIKPSPTRTPTPTAIPTLKTTLPTRTATRTLTPRITSGSTVGKIVTSSSGGSVGTMSSDSEISHADSVIGYNPVIVVKNKGDIDLGDIVQRDSTDTSYDQYKAYLIQNYLPETDQYLLISLTRDPLAQSPWYAISGENAVRMYSGALIREYPTKVGHATGTIPTKKWVTNYFGDGKYEWSIYP